MAVTFRVAHNPDPDSTLPYLVRVPVPGGPLVLRAKEPWPRTSKVYCHDSGDEWTDDLEVVEEVPVRDCVRRGRSIDLVLDRRQLNRSQFVFVTLKGGRPAIFWQSARTVSTVRPGVRLPTRRAAGIGQLSVVRDTRERYGYDFSTQQAQVSREALPAGDYGIRDGAGRLVAVVERKSLDDLAGRLADGTLSFAMSELAALPRAAVVVEGRYADLFALDHVTPGFVVEQLSHLQVRYPSVTVMFCGSRKFAEEWTFRWLGAAARELDAAESVDETVPDHGGDLREGDVLTYLEGGTWKNRAHGNVRATSVHDSYDEALSEGRRLAREREVAHHVRRPPGDGGQET